MEIQGRIIQVLAAAGGTSKAGNAWRKQEYVLETTEQYPRKVVFNFFNNSIDQYPLQVGDDIILTFSLESRSYVGRDGVERWSTEVRGLRADKVDAVGFAPAAPQYQAAPQPMPAPQYAAPQPAVPQYPTADSAVEPQPQGTDDLPF